MRRRPGSFQLAIDYAPHDARVVIVGLCMAADTFFPAKALTKELDLSFAFIYRKRDFEIVIDLLGRDRIDPRGMVTEPGRFRTLLRRLRGAQAPERSDQGHARARLKVRSVGDGLAQPGPLSRRTRRARAGPSSEAIQAGAGPRLLSPSPILL